MTAQQREAAEGKSERKMRHKKAGAAMTGSAEGFLERAGVFLTEHLKLDRPGKGKQDLQQELISVYAGGRETVKTYYVKKVKLILLIIAGGMLLILASLFMRQQSGGEVECQRLQRPGYGEGDRKEALAVQIDGEEVQEFEITVQERQYTEQEKQELIERSLQRLEELLPGENESLDEVRSDLIFPGSLENGAVKISWATIPYGIIDESGALLGSEDENGVLVEIQGTLICGGKEARYTAFAKVFPQKVPEAEQFHQLILREVEQADAREGSKETLKLPETVDGRSLLWMHKKENPLPALVLLIFGAAAGVWVCLDHQVHSQYEERKNQLMLSYPDLLWKMTMLLGAGLSIHGAFTRISEQYLNEKRSRKTHKRCYAYEEVTHACYEMQSGIPEAEAYERFGRRCQLPEYIRLGAVLSQNLKKGSKGLTELLETEAAASLTERKSNVRKLGEKAGTKLLLPMMLMLGIVLAVLMIPALLSF